MRRSAIVLGSCIGVLTACGSESSSELFRSPSTSAGATGGGTLGGGFGGAGLLGGTGGTATGSAPIVDTGGASYGLGGNGIGGLAYGFGGTATGGIVGLGGVIDTGGASSGGGSGDGGSSATGGAIGEGGAGGAIGNYASAAAADCNGTPCATAGGGICCVIVSNNNGTRTVYGTCISSGGTCSIPFSTRASCDGPEDCANGSVCCGTLGTVPGNYTELACVPAASCTGTGKQIMCHPGRASSCTSNVCNRTLTLPDGYGACG